MIYFNDCQKAFFLNPNWIHLFYDSIITEIQMFEQAQKFKSRTKNNLQFQNALFHYGSKWGCQTAFRVHS